MRLNEYANRLIWKGKGLHHWLNLIFALFFLAPVCAFIFFGLKNKIINEDYFYFFLLFFLIFSLAGFFILRKIFDRVTSISREISEKLTSQFFIDQTNEGNDELNNIMENFGKLEGRFDSTFGQLQKKVTEISALRELADLCYVTFDPEEILYVTLERALKLTGSDIGSVLMLDLPQRKHFVVKAAIGLSEEHLTVGDRVVFSDSIAKYAVINKSPLIVEDIENDMRFGRKNRGQYGTKSFVCMPLRTMRNIIGVITLSRKEDETPFTGKDVEVLGPLLSNAAFTYENLSLVNENRAVESNLEHIQKIVQIINSSLRGEELLHAILHEIETIVSFDMSMVLMKDATRTNDIKLLYFMANHPVQLSKDVYYPYPGSVFDKVFKQGLTLIIEDTSRLVHLSEREFLSEGKSCIIVPLKIENTVNGFMVLRSEKPDSFYKLREFIERAADALSLAIERTRLSNYVIKRDRELGTLKQIGSALASSTFDISQVLNYTMDMIRAVMSVEAGALLLMREDGLEFTVTLNLDMEKLNGVRIKVGQGVAGYVAARGNPVIVNDMDQSSLFSADVDTVTPFHTKALLCVPMISEGKVTGVIEVLNKMDGDFDSSDKQLLQSIASSVSVAIENANHYNETVSMAENEREIRNIFQKFVPKEIVERIIHGTDTSQIAVEEFRMLTLINIDIRGFSPLAQKIGPQKTVLMLNRFFSVMGEIVFKNQGIIDKYLGDGFLAIFGAPISSMRDADNAVTAALGMKEAITEINEYWLKEIGDPITVGISVHTGEVVVGNIGFDKKMDYSVVGDSVNTVFRLQAMTKAYPNSILISDRTLRAVKAELDVREIDAVDVPLANIKVYELKGTKSDSVKIIN